MTHLAHIALGGNLGDRRAHLDRALESLRNQPDIDVRKVSRYYETPPVGGPGGQGAFLNAAAEIATTLDPFALLTVLHSIENDAGRRRLAHWGERTLDLDLILYEDVIHDTPRLAVPHPRFSLRRFVLVPLAEIASEDVDPVTGCTVANLLTNLHRRPSSIGFTQTPPDPHNVNFVRQNLSDDPDPWHILEAWTPKAPNPRNPTFAIHFGSDEAAILPLCCVPILRLDPSNSTQSLQAELRAACAATRVSCEPID